MPHSASIAFLGCFSSAFAVGTVDQTVLRAGQVDSRVSPALESGVGERTLRICDAFAGSTKLQIKSLKGNTDLGTVFYKDCVDHQLSLIEGDQLQFKALEPTPIDVGTFAVAGIPKATSAPLLLIVSNKKNSTTATFKSHAFGEPSEGAAQVAVVDTFVGTDGNHSLRIKDDASTETSEMVEQRIAEDLPFNAVVAVSPGTYSVELSGQQKTVGTATLRAGAMMNYVVMRVGGVSDAPEEIVVYPQTAGATRAVSLAALLLGIFSILQ